MKKAGVEFLNQKDSQLEESKHVEHEQKRREVAIKQQNISKEDTHIEIKIAEDPVIKISNWMELLERTHLSHRDNPQVVERIKNYYYNQLILKPENLTQSYLDSQAEFLIRQGRGGDLTSIGVRKVEYKTDEGEQKAHYIFPKERKNVLAETIRTEQKQSLEKWIDYLMHPDTDMYPMWTKYWIFNGMVKLSKYDKEKKAFSPRLKDSVAPFPELNQEALAIVFDGLVKKYGKEYFELREKKLQLEKELRKVIQQEGKQNIINFVGEKYGEDDTKFPKILEIKTSEGKNVNLKKTQFLKIKKDNIEDLNRKDIETNIIEIDTDFDTLLEEKELAEIFHGSLESEDFGLLYAYALEKSKSTYEGGLENTDGFWVKYDRGTNNKTIKTLLESLEGQGTGWCTATEGVARTQLQQGDFYIYYNKDKEGNRTKPRAAYTYGATQNS
jgi:hypothetical protein